MTNEFALFKGCFIPLRLPFLEQVGRRVLNDLGVNLSELPFTCCPEPIGFGIVNKLSWLSIAARNLCIAEEAGSDILTLCNGCLYTLRQANATLRNNTELMDKVNEVLSPTGHQFKGSIEVKHFIEVLNEDVGISKLKELVKTPLSQLTIAGHTGCHIVSPPEIMRFDDPYDPVVLDRIVESLGAVPIDYDLKTLCCGWTLLSYGTRESSAELLKAKLIEMKKAGADCLTVICPQCFYQFDTGQVLSSRETQLGFKLPVLYLLQLVGLAMGYSLEDIHYDMHRVRDQSLERRINRR